MNETTEPIRTERRPGAVLQALREGTRELHSVLDQTSPLTDPGLTEALYLDHAEQARQWYHAIEQQLLDIDWPEPMLQALRFEKAAWIEQDLLAGGRLVSDLQGMPSPELPRPTTLAAAFGAAYVAEGSTLGGLVLQRRLSPRLRLPLRWPQGYGEATGTLWREFCQLMAQHVQGPDAIAEAVSCARDTFRSFRRCVLEGAPALIQPVGAGSFAVQVPTWS